MSKGRSGIASSNSLSAQDWHTKGNNSADDGDYEEAIKCYEEALKINPDFAKSYNNIAFYSDKLGYDSEQVLAAYDKAIEIDSHGLLSYVNKAHKLVELGRSEEAIACLQTAIDDNPNNAEAYDNMAIQLIKLDQREEAIDFFKKAIELDPNNDLNFYGFGTNLLYLGESKKAAGCLEEAKDYFEDSIIYYEKAIELNPENDSYYINMACSLRCLGRNEEALAANEKAVELNPEHPDSHCCKGQTLLAMGREKEALQCLNMAYEKSKTVKLEPDADIPYTQKSLDTLKLILSIDRAALLEKYKDLEEITTQTEENIAKLDANDPEVQQMTKGFEGLKEEKSKSMAQLFNNQGGKNDADEAAQVTELMNQMQIFSQMVMAQQQKQIEIEVTIEQHSIRIDRLEFSQYEMRALKNQMAHKGIDDDQQVHLLEFLRDMKEQSEQQASKWSDINNDPYKSEFVYEFRHVFNATFIAAMAVQTDIVDNNKKSLLGNVGVAVETAGYVIPTVGAGLQFLGAAMSFIDQKQQEVLVKRFAEIAVDANQMSEIAADLAGILVSDEFDKNMLHDHSRVTSKLPTYYHSFMKATIGIDKGASEEVEVRVKTKSVSSKIKKAFFPSSIFKKKAAAAEKHEENKDEVAPYKPFEEGKKDATILSSIIISKVFDGKIEASDRSSDSIVKAMVHSVSELFNMDEQTIEGLFAGAALAGQTLESHHAEEVVEIGNGSMM